MGMGFDVIVISVDETALFQRSFAIEEHYRNWVDNLYTSIRSAEGFVIKLKRQGMENLNREYVEELLNKRGTTMASIEEMQQDVLDEIDEIEKPERTATIDRINALQSGTSDRAKLYRIAVSNLHKKQPWLFQEFQARELEIVMSAEKKRLSAVLDDIKALQIEGLI